MTTDPSTGRRPSRAVAAGIEVADQPLLVLDGDPIERGSPAAVRHLGPDDPELAAVQAAIHVGFGQDDTRTGPASGAARSSASASSRRTAGGASPAT